MCWLHDSKPVWVVFFRSPPNATQNKVLSLGAMEPHRITQNLLWRIIIQANDRYKRNRFNTNDLFASFVCQLD